MHGGRAVGVREGDDGAEPVFAGRERRQIGGSGPPVSSASVHDRVSSTASSETDAPGARVTGMAVASPTGPECQTVMPALATMTGGSAATVPDTTSSPRLVTVIVTVAEVPGGTGPAGGATATASGPAAASAGGATGALQRFTSYGATSRAPVASSDAPSSAAPGVMPPDWSDSSAS